jgi:hypothetical protein
VVIRFRFRLRPVTEISPWGPERRLHWFGLTDGWYWIDAGGLELLRYVPRAAPGQAGDGPVASNPYVDYYVARLWEDVLELLPAVLEPVPGDLAEFMASDPDDWVSRDEAQAEAAAEWYGGHLLDMGYVRCPPLIRWWRRTADGHDSTVLAWRHRSGEAWFAGPRAGQVTMPTSAFVAAVEELDRELLSAMEERIAGLERSGPPPGVRIDLRQLRAEQRDRAAWRRRRPAQVPATDWAKVRAEAGLLLGR